jgi:hypothetical protein
MKGKIGLVILAVLVLVGGASPQAATQHGILATWTASTAVVSGYQLFRCTGVCTSSSTGWIAVTTGLITGTSYLDPRAVCPPAPLIATRPPLLTLTVMYLAPATSHRSPWGARFPKTRHRPRAATPRFNDEVAK